jgi:hypothetical protein
MRTSLRLPARPDAFVDMLAGEARRGILAHVGRLAPRPSDFEVAQGRVDLHKLDALEAPPSEEALPAHIDAMLPDADLRELLLEIAARSGFTKRFTHEREPPARLPISR